jgi:hypothetical protein
VREKMNGIKGQWKMLFCYMKVVGNCRKADGFNAKFQQLDKGRKNIMYSTKKNFKNILKKSIQTGKMIKRKREG